MMGKIAGIAVFGTFSGLFVHATLAQATPETPDRPGRTTVEPPSTPPAPQAPLTPPANQPTGPMTPARPGRGVVTDVRDLSDEDLLNETAAEMGETPPSQRLDQQLLNWYGLRPKLDDAGVDVAATWTIDDSKALVGGLDTEKNILRNLFDLRVNLDTRALFGLKGGTFSIDFQNQSGTNGSEVVGDIQGFDNADADGRTQISEVWYQQIFANNQLRVKIGKVDANTEFAFPEYGANFLNSSFGHSPTLISMPTYPDPAMSVNVFVYPDPHWYVGAGIYDGSGITGLETGSYGPSNLLHSGETYFYIGETGYRWTMKENTLPGRLAVGGTYHSGQFDTFDGGTQTGAASVYGLLEQKLWHEKFYDKTSEEGLYGFLQYGHTDGNVSNITDQFGAGLTWVGPYTKKNPDTIGIGVTAARLTDEPGAGFTENAETSIETFYNFQATTYLSIKPDLQYIINPGGDESIDNALVLTVRLTLAF